MESDRQSSGKAFHPLFHPASSMSASQLGMLISSDQGGAASAQATGGGAATHSAISGVAQPSRATAGHSGNGGLPQKRVLAPTQQDEKGPAPVQQTEAAQWSNHGRHLNELPESIIFSILSLVNSSSGNQAIRCMQVCRLWKDLIPAAVTRLTVVNAASPLHVALQMCRFENLQQLEVRTCWRDSYEWRNAFKLLGEECKGIASLHIGGANLPDNGTASLAEHLRGLEHLKLERCTLENLPSLENLPCLRSLVLEHNHRLQDLPLLHTALSLTSLHISDCLAFRTISAPCFPPPIRKLHISLCPILAELPQLVSTPSLEDVQISHCPRLTFIKLHNTPCLRVLHLEGCSLLTSLFPLGSFRLLEVLNLVDCPFLPPTPPPLRNLVHLRRLSLTVDTHSGLEALRELTSLREMHLMVAEAVAVLPEGLQALEILSLKLVRGPGVQVIPDSPKLTRLVLSLRNRASLALGSLPNLEKMSVAGLTEMPELSTNLKNLRRVRIWDSAVTSVERLGLCQNIRRLRLVDCPSLCDPPPIASLPYLVKLTIQDCPALMSLPRLQSLRLCTLKLAKSGIEQLELGPLPHLLTLTVSDCPNLKRLDIPTLPLLVDLEVRRCTQLRGLSLSPMPSLRRLSFMGCLNLQSTPTFGGLDALTSLDLRDCAALRALPPLLALTNLRVLALAGCRSLEKLPPVWVEKLATVDLRGCAGIEREPFWRGLKRMVKVFYPHDQDSRDLESYGYMR